MENGNRKQFYEVVSGYVKQVKAIDKETEQLEDQLKALKEKKQHIIQFDLPDVFSEEGLVSIKLFDDTRVEIKPYYYARVEEEKKLLFFEWLCANGHGGLIKDHFEVWTKEARVIKMLEEFCKHFEFQYSTKPDVHWKTLESWFKEVTTKGIPVDTSLFKTNIGSKAEIK